ncbi:MAG: fumarylacetoacetate hydrolase family protein [Kurthia sp.]|nr:fumarylacetoacetate hydrolase family protein [Candidatus Kurthia equi]
MINIKEQARYLATAYPKGGVEAITSKFPNLKVKEAYEIQLQTVAHKMEQGHIITGKKIGLTSEAMQNSLNVHEPDYGHLLSDMLIKNNGKVPSGHLLQPKVEGELAFVLKKDLKGPNITAMDVILATDYIVPALEIVDSRIKNWKINLQDTIADNASSGLYVLGDERFQIHEVDFKKIGMALYKNDELLNTGAGVACLGNPVEAVVWLANKLADYTISLKKGEVILSGALSEAMPAYEGDVFACKFNQLGEVRVEF